MSWLYTITPGSTPDTKPIISVIAKRTYDLSHGKVTLSEEQIPLHLNELTIDPANPLNSEAISESDIISYKPCTDIVILADAHTPQGKRAYNLKCEAKIGPVYKAVMVYGDRKLQSRSFRGFSFTEPVPFETMPIDYAHAFGGRAKSKEGTLLPYPPNPLGRGFYLKGGFEDISEIIVPNLEDPSSPINPESLILDAYEAWNDAPKAASFSWTKQGFYPRYTYAGLPPEFLAGALSANPQIDPNQIPKMDFRFYQGASEGLCNTPLYGNEHVVLKYMDPSYPVFEFNLPDEIPTIVINYGSESIKTEPVLQTVLIDKRTNKLSLVWRGHTQGDMVEICSKGQIVSCEIS